MNLLKIRERLLVYFAHEMGLPYFKLFRKTPGFPYTMEELAAMPKGTVGEAMHQFFTANNLSLLTYYERHDIKHVLLNYPPTAEGEVAMQFFMFGNGKISFPILVVVLFGLFLMPEFYGSFFKAFKAGWYNIPLRKVNWFEYIPVPLSTAQYQLLQKL